MCSPMTSMLFAMVARTLKLGAGTERYILVEGREVGRPHIKMAERSKRRGILHLNARGQPWGITILNNVDADNRVKERKVTHFNVPRPLCETVRNMALCL